MAIYDEDPDALDLLVKQGNIGPQERSALRQREMAKALMNSSFAAKGRNDVGSNIGRAASGIGAGLGYYNAGKADAGALGERMGFQSKLANALRSRQFRGLAQKANAATGVTGDAQTGGGVLDDEDVERWQTQAGY